MATATRYRGRSIANDWTYVLDKKRGEDWMDGLFQIPAITFIAWTTAANEEHTTMWLQTGPPRSKGQMGSLIPEHVWMSSTDQTDEHEAWFGGDFGNFQWKGKYVCTHETEKIAGKRTHGACFTPSSKKKRQE